MAFNHGYILWEHTQHTHMCIISFMSIHFVMVVIPIRYHALSVLGLVAPLLSSIDDFAV